MDITTRGYGTLTPEQWNYAKAEVDKLGFVSAGHESIFIDAVYELDRSPFFLIYYYGSQNDLRYEVKVATGAFRDWQTDWATYQDMVAKAVAEIKRSWS